MEDEGEGLCQGSSEGSFFSYRRVVEEEGSSEGCIILLLWGTSVHKPLVESSYYPFLVVRLQEKKNTNFVECDFLFNLFAFSSASEGTVKSSL